MIGIDEWAWRKGQRYGVIISDHITGRPVDLLAECSREAVIERLKGHPAIDVITRDRSELFADALRQAVPQAVQVADRWHLIKNIGDLVDKILGFTSVLIRDEKGKDNPDEYQRSDNEDLEATSSESTSTPGQQRREERYRLIRERYAELRSIRAVAEQLNLSRVTVRKYLRASECPTHRGRPRGSRKLRPYMGYLERRWQEGCRNAAQLYQELVAAGFDGSSSLLRAFLRRWRIQAPKENVQTETEHRVPLGPRHLRKLFYKDIRELNDRDRRLLETILDQDPGASEVYQWVQEFRHIVHERDTGRFFQWLERSERSAIRRIQGFVGRIRRDIDAVVAAIQLPWSNGRTEGHIHRLKLLKRQMYGRAGIELLRRRFLLT